MQHIRMLGIHLSSVQRPYDQKIGIRVKPFAGRNPSLSRRYRRLSCHVRCRQCKRLPENMVSLEHNTCQHCPAFCPAGWRSLNVPSLRTRPVALSWCLVPHTRLDDKWYGHRANNERSFVFRRQASGTIIHADETVPRSCDTIQPSPARNRPR
jgi:hypothetical protein